MSLLPPLPAGQVREGGSGGCLSVPDLAGDVKRVTRLVARGVVPGTGAQAEIETDGFEASALQHEIDHPGGLLFLDRAAGAHTLHPRQTYLCL